MDVEKWTDKELERLESRVKRVYKEAYDDMNQKLDRYLNGYIDEAGHKHLGMYDRIAKEKVAFDRGVYSEKQWKEYLTAQMKRAEHFRALRDEYSNRLVKAELEVQKLVNGELPKIYVNNSNDIVKQVNEELERLRRNKVGNVNPENISFELIDEETVRRYLTGSREVRPYKPIEIDIIKSSKWNNTKIQNQLLQGILQGESFRDMARRLARVVGMDEASAMRTVRTAVTGARNKAKQDRYKNLAEKGCVATKVWIDVHDDIPPERPEHWEASGQEVEWDEPFVVGGEELMYPTDTSRGASGWNIYNCRCRMGKGKFKFKSILPEDKQGKIHVREV